MRAASAVIEGEPYVALFAGEGENEFLEQILTVEVARKAARVWMMNEVPEVLVEMAEVLGEKIGDGDIMNSISHMALRAAEEAETHASLLKEAADG